MWRECGKEGQAAGFLITVNTYDSVVRRDETTILYVYIYTYRNFDQQIDIFFSYQVLIFHVTVAYRGNLRKKTGKQV